MNILVTGGAGFIGSHCTERLLADGHTVVVVDDFNDYYDPRIKEANTAGFRDHARIVRADIRDGATLTRLFETEAFDSVLHLAARAGVRPSLEQPVLYQDVNVRGTTELLELARRHGVERFVMASSSSVYGNNDKVPFSEDDPVDHPISPYAASKKACELVGHTFHHLYGMPVTCLRFFTVYGPRQRPDMAIHKFTRLIEDGLPLPMFGDGSTRRDYTYIDDIVDGVMRSIERCRAFHVYNLGESRTISLADLIRDLGQAIGREPIIDRRPLQPGDVSITYADVSRARAELGYDPRIGTDVGLPRFVEWYRRMAARDAVR